MKGLIALAKKNESISDKIVRLYKEGYSIPEIAKEMEMPKDNVPRILEKHFPDYASFEQPVREGADENGNGKKSVFIPAVRQVRQSARVSIFFAVVIFFPPFFNLSCLLSRQHCQR